MGTPAAAQAFLEATTGADTTLDSFDATTLRGLVVERAERGRLVARLSLGPGRANAYGTAHGGLIATAVDVISSAALHTVADASGVSVSLAVDYLVAAPATSSSSTEPSSPPSLIFDARVVKAGRNLAFLEVDVFDASGRKVAAGRHTKFVGGGEAARSRL
jgi:acyl-coenzyme A thioesterase 13